MQAVAPQTAYSLRPDDAFLSEADRKRFHVGTSPMPILILNPEGNISEMSPAARLLLEYKAEQEVEPCFFSHVHGRNLYQIMRDVADMVCYGKAAANWLLRLRTGRGRWRWYKATVKNRLSMSDGNIVVTLRDLHEW